MKKINQKKIEISLEKAINKYYKRGVKIYEVDKQDLLKVLKAIKEKKYPKAYELAWNLDIIVRGEIPDSVFDLLGEKYCE